MKKIKKFHESLINFMLAQHMVTPRTADIMKMKLIHNMSFANIGDVFDLSEKRAMQLFNSGTSVIEDFGNFFEKMKKNQSEAAFLIRGLKKENTSLRNTVIRKLLKENDSLMKENAELKEILKIHNHLLDDATLHSIAQSFDEAIFEKKIEEFPFQKRVIDALHKARIYTIGEMIDLGEEGLLLVDGIGESSLEKIEKILNENGLTLKE